MKVTQSKMCEACEGKKKQFLSEKCLSVWVFPKTSKGNFSICRHFFGGDPYKRRPLPDPVEKWFSSLFDTVYGYLDGT